MEGSVMRTGKVSSYVCFARRPYQGSMLQGVGS